MMRTSARVSKAKDGAKHRSFVSLSRQVLQFSKVFSKFSPKRAKSAAIRIT